MRRLSAALVLLAAVVLAGCGPSKADLLVELEAEREVIADCGRRVEVVNRGLDATVDKEARDRLYDTLIGLGDQRTAAEERVRVIMQQLAE